MGILGVNDALTSPGGLVSDFGHFNFYYAVKMVLSQATNRV